MDKILFFILGLLIVVKAEQCNNTLYIIAPPTMWSISSCGNYTMPNVSYNCLKLTTSPPLGLTTQVLTTISVMSSRLTTNALNN